MVVGKTVAELIRAPPQLGRLAGLMVDHGHEARSPVVLQIALELALLEVLEEVALAVVVDDLLGAVLGLIDPRFLA